MSNNQPVRCGWAKGEPLTTYHDTEWGTPTTNEKLLYELFLLETFQSGLSWRCILSKREAFRRAFDGFDAHQIANYGDAKIESLMNDAGIIRCRRKIVAAVENARIYRAICAEHGGFLPYLRGFTGDTPIVNRTDEYVTTSEASDRMSADLKRRGMRYVGSVTLYSYLQAVGLVNDHELGCFRHPDHQAK